MLIKKSEVNVDIVNMPGIVENVMKITKDNDYLQIVQAGQNQKIRTSD